jgi:hypothetical protein
MNGIVNISIIMFNLGSRDLTDLDIKGLIDSDLDFSKITELNLSNNKIGHEGCRLLSQINLPLLKLLNL